MDFPTLTLADLPSVARVHVLAFPNAAVSRLGQEAVRRFYATLMAGPPGTHGFGAFVNGQLAGYCFIGVRHELEPRFLRRNAVYLGWQLATHPWLLTYPLFRDRIGTAWRIVKRPFARRTPIALTARGDSVPESGGISRGIQYLVVAPEFHGKGLGEKLLLAGELYARDQGFTQIELSVFTDNHRAIRFYERMGWRRVPATGEWNGLMAKSLAPVKGDSPAASAISPK
jgi:ribosomal protein S18 acetylase RimI-like enzyme